MTRGKFITLEGIDGVGKSTQAALLAAFLINHKKIHAITTREPGGTPFGEQLRKMMFDGGWDGVGEVLLMAAARREHVRHRISPALNDGTWVVCDRFTDSTIAYQGGGRGVCKEWIADVMREVEEDARPDLTFYFRAPDDFSPPTGDDAFEQSGSEFYRAVDDAYRRLAEENPARIITIDGVKDGTRRSVEDIAAEMQKTVETRWP